MKKLASLSIVLGILALTGAASAEETGGRTIRIKEFVIVGRLPRPMAVMDASKVQPHLTAGDLKQDFSGRIELATENEPF
jgi:hypothetical protein